MKWGMAGLVAVALTVAMSGCFDEPAAPTTPDAELHRLTQRVLKLRDEVAATGEITAAQRLELSLLARDVKTWQAQTGRTDISVSNSKPSSGSVAAVAPGGGGPRTCAPCPRTTYKAGQACFLVSEEACPQPGDLVGRVCIYQCFSFPWG